MKNVCTVLLIYISHLLIAQNNDKKFEFDFHSGVTAGKMLWVDKPDKDAPFQLQLPATSFRMGILMGVCLHNKINDKWYNVSSLEFIARRFAIDVEGGFVQAFDKNGVFVAIQTDYIEYRINQISLSSGIGYNIFNRLSVEVQPYFQVAITDQQNKIGKIIDWQKDESFQQFFDFGVSGSMRFNFRKFYIKPSYQYGLRNIQEFSLIDAIGAPLGKFKIRNTLGSFSIGYRF
jgi:hypothetical protein